MDTFIVKFTTTLYQPQHKDVCRKAEKATHSALWKMLSRLPSHTLRVAVQDNTAQTSREPSCRPINGVIPDKRTARQNAKASHLLQGIKLSAGDISTVDNKTRRSGKKKGRRRRRRRTALPAAPGEQWSRREVIWDRTSSPCRRVTNSPHTAANASLGSRPQPPVSLARQTSGEFDGCNFYRRRETHLSIHC